MNIEQEKLFTLRASRRGRLEARGQGIRITQETRKITQGAPKRHQETFKNNQWNIAYRKTNLMKQNLPWAK